MDTLGRWKWFFVFGPKLLRPYTVLPFKFMLKTYIQYFWHYLYNIMKLARYQKEYCILYNPLLNSWAIWPLISSHKIFIWNKQTQQRYWNNSRNEWNLFLRIFDNEKSTYITCISGLNFIYKKRNARLMRKNAWTFLLNNFTTIRVGHVKIAAYRL